MQKYVKNSVPIVFAADDGYAMPTAVAITSLLENKKKKTFYKIYILTPGLSEKHYKKLKSLERDDCIINIIENKTALKDFQANLEKVTSTDYFRLILSRFIREDKVIALAGDFFVLEDLGALYNLDLEDNVLGGCYFRPHDVYNREYVQTVLGLEEGKRINIGVMLMDLKKIREDSLEDAFISNIGKFEVMSEDIINYVCKDKIKYLPIKYNFNLHFYMYREFLESCPRYSLAEYKMAEKRPAIFHYTLNKPWKDRGVERIKLWFKYYKHSPYKEEILPCCQVPWIVKLKIFKYKIFEIKLSNRRFWP